MSLSAAATAACSFGYTCLERGVVRDHNSSVEREDKYQPVPVRLEEQVSASPSTPRRTSISQSQYALRNKYQPVPVRLKDEYQPVPVRLEEQVSASPSTP